MNRIRQQTILSRCVGTTALGISLLFAFACTDPKKSRTERATERLGDAVKADSKDAAAKLSNDLNKAGRTVSKRTNQVKAALRHQRQRVMKDLKISTLR